MSHWYSGRSFGVNSYALKTIISHIPQKEDLDTGFTGDSQCRSGPVVGSTVSTHTRSKPSHIPPKQDLDTGFTGFWLRVSTKEPYAKPVAVSVPGTNLFFGG